MAKHTPGPWRAYFQPEGGFGVYQDDGHGNGDHIMCVSIGTKRQITETHANERLIAAAPEQHAALQSAEAFLAGLVGCGVIGESDGGLDVLNEVKAALAKSTEDKDD